MLEITTPQIKPIMEINVSVPQIRKAATDKSCSLLQANGAEGETRTPTEKPPLDPEPSASTNSATSARIKAID